MSAGFLHWLVGLHPWAKRHPRGLLWLALLLGWLGDAVTWFGTAEAWVVDTCDLPHGKDCNHAAVALPLVGWLVGFGLLVATVALIWGAEERRSRPAVETESEAREARAARIAALEDELGISS